MASFDVRDAEEGAMDSRGTHAQGSAFQQGMQWLTYFKEVLLGQERSNQDTMPEQKRRVENRFAERDNTILESCEERKYRRQDDGRTTKATLNSMEEDTWIVISEDNLLRKEKKMEVGEERFLSSGGQNKIQLSGHGDRVFSNEATLESDLLRVDTLNQKEVYPLPVPCPQPEFTSVSTYGDITALSPPSSFASVSSPSPASLRSPSAGNASPPSLTPEQRKALGEKLLKAAEFGKEADVQTLLDHGADINFPDSSGMTPLMHAFAKAEDKVVWLLIGRGANVHARNTAGETALHFATLNHENAPGALLLIRMGAQVNSADEAGMTPLHRAANWDNVPVAQVLLAAGASKRAKATNGETPLEWASTDAMHRLLRA